MSAMSRARSARTGAFNSAMWSKRLLRFLTSVRKQPRSKSLSSSGKRVPERSRSMWGGWRALAERPGAAALALVALCLAVYMPGILRLPAVDRTEIIYAETTRDMVAHGDWTDPRYGDV